MDIVSYKTADFVLTVINHRTADLYAKASRKISNISQSSGYDVAGPEGILEVWYPAESTFMEIKPGKPCHPVFFENSDYIFDVEFSNTNISSPRVYSRLKEVSEKFSAKNRGAIQTLTGTLNYGNDIGKYDFVLRYEKSGRPVQFSLSFEVFPTKLDYKNDYRRIVEDIEKEYSHLVLDFLRKTYSNFKTNSSNTNDLVWWSVFGTIYKELLNSARLILNKPHNRLVSYEEYCKRDRLRRLTPELEEKLVLFRENPNKLYRTVNKRLTTDTTDNRFLKFAMRDVERRFLHIRQFIQNNRQYVISEEFEEELTEIARNLRGINAHPFFKSIGEFKGMNQESLVLQKKTGYSSVYRNWLLLKQGLSLFEGIQKIDLKDIAELYQIWCFLRMKGMIQRILGKEPLSVDLAEVQVDNFLFTLKKGKASKVVFENDQHDRIELYHDYTFPYLGKSETLSFTVEQRPDIVLKISKSDLKENYAFTYLYDAKYRLQSDIDENKPDTPPNDAINQMHRYRDAIYYLDCDTQVRGKEVIGGYILFPGAGEVPDIRERGFFKSISDVNIGAFPLLPNDTYASDVLLVDHLKTIMHVSSPSVLREVIPHKGMQYEEPDGWVLLGSLGSQEQRAYFESGSAEMYHMPLFNKSGQINTLKKLEQLKYFCPGVNGKQDLYRIRNVMIVKRNEIFREGDPFNLFRDSTDNYYVFSLERLPEISIAIKNTQGGNRIFRYAKLSELRAGVIPDNQ